MKSIKRLLTILFLLPAALSHAQGPLTPPGAPAPTMKSLDQIEARIPVQSLAASAPYTITQPGSYYLTANITVGNGNAIIIDSDDVSLDLNGFTIRSNYIGGGHSGAAITTNVTHARLTVRNGSIVSGTSVPASGPPINAGFAYGIGAVVTFTESSVTNVHIRGVNTGIYLQQSGMVERCTVSNCGNFGILTSSIGDSTANLCFGKALSAAERITNCSGTSTASIGLECVKNVSNSSGVSSTSTGIYCGGSATNCSGTSNTGIGLYCVENASNSSGTSSLNAGLTCLGNVSNCNGTSSSGYGIFCEGNATNSTGKSVTGGNGLLVGGTASFCRGGRPSGTAISAANAIGCTAISGGITAPLKSLGTP